jgi:hypothetical protein
LCQAKLSTIFATKSDSASYVAKHIKTEIHFKNGLIDGCKIISIQCQRNNLAIQFANNGSKIESVSLYGPTGYKDIPYLSTSDSTIIIAKDSVLQNKEKTFKICFSIDVINKSDEEIPTLKTSCKQLNQRTFNKAILISHGSSDYYFPNLLNANPCPSEFVVHVPNHYQAITNGEPIFHSLNRKKDSTYTFVSGFDNEISDTLPSLLIGQLKKSFSKKHKAITIYYDNNLTNIENSTFEYIFESATFILQSHPNYSKKRINIVFSNFAEKEFVNDDDFVCLNASLLFSKKHHLEYFQKKLFVELCKALLPLKYHSISLFEYLYYKKVDSEFPDNLLIEAFKHKNKKLILFFENHNLIETNLLLKNIKSEKKHGNEEIDLGSFSELIKNTKSLHKYKWILDVNSIDIKDSSLIIRTLTDSSDFIKFLTIEKILVQTDSIILNDKQQLIQQLHYVLKNATNKNVKKAAIKCLLKYNQAYDTIVAKMNDSIDYKIVGRLYALNESDDSLFSVITNRLEEKNDEDITICLAEVYAEKSIRNKSNFFYHNLPQISEIQFRNFIYYFSEYFFADIELVDTLDSDKLIFGNLNYFKQQIIIEVLSNKLMELVERLKRQKINYRLYYTTCPIIIPTYDKQTERIKLSINILFKLIDRLNNLAKTE